MCCKAVCNNPIGACVGANMNVCPTGYYCQSPNSFSSICCKAVCYNSIGICAMDNTGHFSLCPTGFYCDNPYAGFGGGSCCQK
uniref:Uncharacterized protein n=1 Tax=Acrobeloides nanus TaxID=290746 RepID=A0A914DSK3_9BILA